MRRGQRTGRIFAVTGRLIAASWIAVFGCIAALTATGAAIDAVLADQRADVIYSLLSIFTQFLLTSRLLLRAGLHHAWGKPGRAASFIGAGIVTGLAILFGLLLILPGLYLAARWLLVCPLIVGRGMTMGEALAESWRRTAGHVLPFIAVLALVFGLGSGGSLLTMMLTYPAYGPASPVPAVAANLLLSSALVLGWCVAVSAYSILAPEEQTQTVMPEGNPATA
jgi:hypothetical protein